ncbi:MAG: methyl-accepting chemotaxis protein [Nitrospinota bacterium]|nr:methyl-accepting chemotaxis protein [Nitrospinota bacterium]
MSFFKNLKVGIKIGGGFAAVGFILLVTVGLAIWQTNSTKAVTDRVVELRSPTLQASMSMMNGINHSLAALRAWMILGEGKFKTERGIAWNDEIDPSMAQMMEFSKNWTDPANVKRLTMITDSLEKLRGAQKEIEDISGTMENTPANKTLLLEAAPQAAVIISNITKIIDLEANNPATKDRKSLLGMMADVRGSMGMSLANIRAFLLSGDQKFKDEFQTAWEKNERRFKELVNSRHLLTSEQQRAFEKLKQARKLFEPLPSKMFEIRGGKEWNLANYWLGLKAAPLALEIKKNLDEMIVSQKGLLVDEMATAKSKTAFMVNFLWILLLIGLAFCAVLGITVTRSISVPIGNITGLSMGIIEGNLKQEEMKITSNDEIGMLGQNFNKMMDVLKQFIQHTEEILQGRAKTETFGLKGDFEGSLGSMLEMSRREREQQEAQARKEREENDALMKKVDSILEVVDAAANGDLTREITIKGDDALGKMGDRLQLFFTDLRKSVKTINENAMALAGSSEQMTSLSQKMASTAEETSAQAGAVSSASEQVSKNIETVATSAEEMNSSIQEIARNVNEASNVTAKAVTMAKKTNKSISDLGKSSSEIGDVIKVITSIAEQTNLLALNATIEAARAGEAGKGFAVVANEVKELASQTAEATEDISRKIMNIQAKTTESVEAIGEITEIISNINEISSTIASSVEEQTATTSEIGRNVTEAAKGSGEIANNITGVASAAADTAQGATENQKGAVDLASMAADLQKLVARFRI